VNADQETPSGCSTRVLDWLNVFLADVRAGIGPCLAINLLTTYNARAMTPASASPSQCSIQGWDVRCANQDAEQY
jgi:hypothetical protein